MQEIGIDVRSLKVRVRVSEKYYRPAEVDLLIGNPSKAVQKLGWKPQSTSFKVLFCPAVLILSDNEAGPSVFQELVREMVESDINHLKDKLVTR